MKIQAHTYLVIIYGEEIKKEELNIKKFSNFVLFHPNVGIQPGQGGIIFNFLYKKSGYFYSTPFSLSIFELELRLFAKRFFQIELE